MQIMATKKKNRIIAFPLYDGVTLTDFTGPTEVFSFTNGFTPIWMATEKRFITTSEGAHVFPHYAFHEKHPPIDILFVPGGGAPGVIKGGMFDKAFQDFLRKTAITAQWTGSVCTGAFILAAAGLLNDCTVTTYWNVIDDLALLKDKFNLRFPEDKYVRGVIDSRRKRFTGGGISSSIDLALMLVEKLVNKKAAERAQLYIQYAPQPPVHAGDPTQAPAALLKQVRKEQKAYNQLYAAAVKKLLKTNKP